MVIKNLVARLCSNGLLIFAVHNPEYVELNLKADTGKYINFDSTDKPKRGMIVLDGVKIPFYVRNSQEYDSMLNKLGLIKTFEYYPPFTDEYLAQHPTKITEVSRFLLLAYTTKGDARGGYPRNVG